MFNKRKYFYKVNVEKRFDVNSVQYPGVVIDGLSSADDSASSASASASASSATSASAAAPAAAAEPSRGGSAFGTLEPWVMFANVFAILNALLWLLPLEIAEGGFTRAVLTVVGVNLLSLYRRHGRPRFSKEYAQKIMTDERAHHCFHLAICSGSKPMLLMLVPHCIRALVFITRYAPAYIGGGVAERLGAERLAQLNQVCGQMRAQESQLLQQGAVFDIYLFGILVVYLVTGQCSFLTVMLYGQWLRAKYFVSNSCKTAFYQTRQSFDGVFRHEKCPALVTRAYASVVGVLSGWGEIPRPPPAAPAAAADAGAGGAASGIGKYCVVM